MKIVVQRILTDSIAEELGIRPDDEIVAINGRQDLEDMLDYQFEVLGSEYLELWVRHTDGSEEIYDIEKNPDDDLGLIFVSPVFTPIKTCNNACPFCFIDQQPEGLRASLYVKDDDYRLSYFNNTYITLTNLTAHDRERISRLRPGPLYVSVHSTVPHIRQELLQNKKAGNIMSELSWLKSLEIPFHCQIVVCPGINDTESLSRSLEDLWTLRPEALSVAVVPVGLTKHREHLPALQLGDEQSAIQVIQRVKTFESRTGSGFVYLSDEFYLKANLPLPSYDAYGNFPQLDDGVGTVRLLLNDFFTLEASLPKALAVSQKIVLLTGQYAAHSLQPMINRLNTIKNLYIDVLPVESHFWGVPVSVAGLITGQDILETVSKHDMTGYTYALIPSVMLKQGTDVFLDDRRISDIAQQIQLPIHVIQNPYSASELIQTLLTER